MAVFSGAAFAQQSSKASSASIGEHVGSSTSTSPGASQGGVISSTSSNDRSIYINYNPSVGQQSSPPREGVSNSGSKGKAE